MNNFEPQKAIKEIDKFLYQPYGSVAVWEILVILCMLVKWIFENMEVKNE